MNPCASLAPFLPLSFRPERSEASAVEEPAVRPPLSRAPWFTKWTVALGLLAISSSLPAQTLREEAQAAGVLIGTAVRQEHLSEPAYAITIAREYNLVEPEDAMKWWVLRPTRNAFDFRQGDAIVHFAKAHGMKVRGHCLLWGRSNPDWLTQGNFTPTQLADLAKQHVSTVVRHYAGEVFAWDVVNEALDENGEPRDTIWNTGLTTASRAKRLEYIEQAFHWAHVADPKALLFYNEAEAEGLGRKSDAVYAMLKDFRERGVPVDGIGLQMHIPSLSLDAAAIAANIARLTRLGLQVHITELDVALPVDAEGNPRDPADLNRQAFVYADIVRACLQQPGCTAIQTWGFTDRYSWIGSSSHKTRGSALPFDHDYQKKPAYEALQDALRERLHPH
jgi:endo-1,4-beta-xylanase